MHRIGWLVLLLFLAAPVWGQDRPTYDQLEKAHEDTLAQLKNAQDRRNELATDNEQLQSKLTDVQKQLDEARTALEALRQEKATWAEKTYFYRSMYGVWQDYLSRYPKWQADWNAYLARPLLSADPSLPALPATDPASVTSTEPVHSSNPTTTQP